mgnify:CR=1 FL=1
MSTKYKIVFRRDYHTISDRTVLGQASTLAEAAALRKVSGDLVTLRGLVVDSEEWLFPWEKEKPDCYARLAILADRSVKKRKKYKDNKGIKKPYKRSEREWKPLYDSETRTIAHQWHYPRL